MDPEYHSETQSVTAHQALHTKSALAIQCTCCNRTHCALVQVMTFKSACTCTATAKAGCTALKRTGARFIVARHGMEVFEALYHATLQCCAGPAIAPEEE